MYAGYFTSVIYLLLLLLGGGGGEPLQEPKATNEVRASSGYGRSDWRFTMANEVETYLNFSDPFGENLSHLK